jgi:lipid A 3-O-deacylase
LKVNQFFFRFKLIIAFSRVRIIFLIPSLFICGLSFSQEESRDYSNEIAITLDNDVFLFSDWYYTAGHEFSYRKLLSNERPLTRWMTRTKETSKAIVSFNIGNKIFTPKRTQFANPINMDRPYVGFEYGSVSITRIKGTSLVSSLEFELGLLGEVTGLGKLQQWWHTRAGFEIPSGWETQIANEVVLNINYFFQRGFTIIKEIDLVSTSALTVGTGTNKISQDLTVRLFNFNPIGESVFSGNRIAINGNSKSEEIFIFGGIGVDYIMSNIFLEGSLFKNNQSIFTVEATPWVMRSNVGIMYARSRGSFALSVTNLTKEVANGSSHGYGSIAFSLRF